MRRAWCSASPSPSSSSPPAKRDPDVEDCTACRAVGAAAAAGIAGYLLLLRAQTPRHNVSQRMFLAGFAAVVGAAGLYRVVG
jgi:hypothetical protein